MVTMSRINLCIDEVMVAVDVGVEVDDNNQLQIEILEIFPEGIYTEREIILLVKKELHQLREEKKLEFLLNQYYWRDK
jgi:hypothetical protein